LASCVRIACRQVFTVSNFNPPHFSYSPTCSHYNLFVEFGGAFGISFPSSNAAAAPAAGSGSGRNFSNDFASSEQSSGGYQSGPVSTYQPMPMPPPASSGGYQGISDAKSNF
jgi:hypothetical protein